MIGLRQSGALPSFQASWGRASTRDGLHAYLFKEIAPVLVLMVYSFLSHRMGYRLLDKLTAAVAKPGVLPQWLVDYGIFTSFCQNLVSEVVRSIAWRGRHRHDGSLLRCLRHRWRSLTGRQRGRSTTPGWWRRIASSSASTSRAHADLCYLALEDSRELPQAKLASPRWRQGPAAMPLPPAIRAPACGRC